MTTLLAAAHESAPGTKRHFGAVQSSPFTKQQQHRRPIKQIEQFQCLTILYPMTVSASISSRSDWSCASGTATCALPVASPAITSWPSPSAAPRGRLRVPDLPSNAERRGLCRQTWRQWLNAHSVCRARKRSSPTRLIRSGLVPSVDSVMAMTASASRSREPASSSVTW
jgi:hypothetical protein